MAKSLLKTLDDLLYEIGWQVLVALLQHHLQVEGVLAHHALDLEVGAVGRLDLLLVQQEVVVLPRLHNLMQDHLALV